MVTRYYQKKVSKYFWIRKYSHEKFSDEEEKQKTSVWKWML